MRAADNAMNVVVLDACRNNPFSRSFRTLNPGLAQVNAAAGTFISFATAPGQIAADGEGSSGLFTSKLLDHIGTPGLKIEEVFKRTTADVYSASNKRQAPWVQYSVIGDFYFAPGDIAPATVDVKPQEPTVVKTLYIDTFSDFSDRNSWKTKRIAVDDLVYNGSVRYGLPNGRGSLKDEEAELVGEFVNGFPNEWMTATYNDGRIKNLYFKDGEWVQNTTLPSTEPEPVVVLSGEVAKKILLETKECAGCNLTGTSLTKIDLSYTNLAEAKLLAVNLQGSNLQGSNLQGSNLQGSNLQGSNLQGSDLRFADLTGANLRDANLVRAMLDAANLRDANLRRANLFEANLGGTNLRNASLREANLSGVTLHKANIEGADLWYANLKDVNLIGVEHFRGASLGYTRFCNTTMPDGFINNRDC